MRRASIPGKIVPQIAFCLSIILPGGLASTALGQSIAIAPLTLPQPANSIAWDPTRSRFFAGAGTNVLMINPETAQIEDTIPVVDRANQIAVSGDGQYLYVSLQTVQFPYQNLGFVNRYRIQSHALDLQIPLGPPVTGSLARDAQAMVALPGQPSSILIATTDHQLIVFDNAVARAGTTPANVRSLYARPTDGAIFGVGDGPGGFGDARVFWIALGNSGVTVSRFAPVNSNWDNGSVTWTGNLIANRAPLSAFVFDLNAGVTIGSLALPKPTGNSGACILAADASGASAFAYQYKFQVPASVTQLVEYSLADFRPQAAVALTGLPNDAEDVSSLCTSTATWGTDGILVNAGGTLYFMHASGLNPLPAAPLPTPTRDAAGVIHLAVAANALVYDSGRNVIWASLPGTDAASGNSVISIDPATGNIINTIAAGSEPGALALSGDGSHLFAALGGAPAVASIDLSAMQSSLFPVLDNSSALYWQPADLAGIAGQSNSVVVVRGAQTDAQGDAHSSVVAYDAGVPRANGFDNLPGAQTYSQYVQSISPADAPNAFYVVDTALHYEDNTHDAYRLVLDSTGISSETKLGNLFLGDADAYNLLAYDSGRLFTSGGQVLTPDGNRLLGSVALSPVYGLPVSFADQGQVVYVQSDTPQVSAISYDLTTLQPLGSVPLLSGPPCGCTSNTLNAVAVTAAVRAGSNAIAVAANGQIVIAPLNTFQPWSSSAAGVQSVSQGVQQLAVRANAMSLLPGTSKLLLATPSTDGGIGNSIAVFNPSTGQIESSAFIGSEPSLLTASVDGSSVYAYLSGEHNVARLNVAAGSRDLEFAADPTGGTSQSLVYDLAADPDGGLAVSYPGGAIAIFDGAVPRSESDSNSQGPFANDPATFHLAFNDAGSTLYAYNSFLSTFELKRESASPQGVQFLSSTGGVISGYSTTIRYAGGLLYTSYGDVIDPERSLVVGQFMDGWLNRGLYAYGQDVAPDIAAGRAYFVTGSGVLVFDIHTYALLARLPISLPAYSQFPLPGLVRFGASGLAFLRADGNVDLINIAAIPLLPAPVSSPQLPFISPNGVVPIYSAVPAVQPGSWISIFGTNLAGSTASWNSDFPLSLAGTSVMIDNRPAYLWYVSPNQINLQVPDDTAAGTVSVKVTTANGTAAGSVTMAAFGPSLSLLDGRHVAAEIPTPDGSGAYGGGTWDLVGPSGYFSFPSRPVHPGETLELYGVGFGPTNPPVGAGQPYTGVAPITAAVTVTIGGKPATVAFSGMVAAGLYQINAVVPPVASGDEPIQATVGGVAAPVATVTVE